MFSPGSNVLTYLEVVTLDQKRNASVSALAGEEENSHPGG